MLNERPPFDRLVTDGPPDRTRRRPDLEVERSLWEAGHAVVAGIDEAGAGAWAGPLSVAAAVVPKDQPIPEGLRDSKAIKKERSREALFDRVAPWCTNWAVGHATHAECDLLGFSEALTLAATRAREALEVVPHRILVDGATDFVGSGNTICLEKGDRTSVSIAAASILAKVIRDRIMRDSSVHFPTYEFEANKGYHSPGHETALRARGPSGIHRRDNSGVMKILRRAGTRHDVQSDPLDLADYARLSRFVEPGGITTPQVD